MRRQGKCYAFLSRNWGDIRPKVRLLLPSITWWFSSVWPMGRWQSGEWLGKLGRWMDAWQWDWQSTSQQDSRLGEIAPLGVAVGISSRCWLTMWVSQLLSNLCPISRVCPTYIQLISRICPCPVFAQFLTWKSNFCPQQIQYLSSWSNKCPSFVPLI